MKIALILCATIAVTAGAWWAWPALQQQTPVPLITTNAANVAIGAGVQIDTGPAHPMCSVTGSSVTWPARPLPGGGWFCVATDQPPGVHIGPNHSVTIDPSVDLSKPLCVEGYVDIGRACEGGDKGEVTP